MSRKQVAIAAAALLIGSLALHAKPTRPLVDQLMDPTTWRDFRWSTVETSELWTNKDLELKASLKGDEPTSRRFSTELYKSHPTVIAAVHHLGPDAPRYSFVLTAEEPGDCEWYVAELTRRFGQPLLSTDESFVVFGTQQRLHVKRWNSNKTAITHECKSMPGSEVFSVTTFFEDVGKFVPQPIIELSCTQSLRSLNPTDPPDPIEPLRISILPFSRAVIGPDRALISLNVLISDSVVSFSTGGPKTAGLQYTIDRISGTISGVARKDAGAIIGTLDGVCTVVDLKERKF